jgi:hypothetical protein
MLISDAPARCASLNAVANTSATDGASEYIRYGIVPYWLHAETRLQRLLARFAGDREAPHPRPFFPFTSSQFLEDLARVTAPPQLIAEQLRGWSVSRCLPVGVAIAADIDGYQGAQTARREGRM